MEGVYAPYLAHTPSSRNSVRSSRLYCSGLSICVIVIALSLSKA